MKRFERLEFREERIVARSEQVHQADFRLQQDEDHDEQYWMKSATEQRRNGMHETALRYYSRALERDKELIAGWVGQVQMLVALGEYSEAELWSRKALELFKNNPNLLAGRAHAKCRLGDLKNAQASADAAIAQQGLHSYPWVVRGELMLVRREALDDYCFDKAMQIDSDWLIPLEIGAIYLHFDHGTKALQRTRVAVEKAPDHAYCWYCQGMCELDLGLTSAAGRSFHRCLELAPKYEPARQRIREQGRRGVRGFIRKLLRLA